MFKKKFAWDVMKYQKKRMCDKEKQKANGIE